MDEKNEVKGAEVKPKVAAKGPMPMEIWIASGAGLLASLFPWISFKGNLSGYGFSFYSAVNGWNAALFGIPSLLAVLALVGVGVIAWLKYEGKWEAPPQLNLGLSIFGGAFPLLLIIVYFGRQGGNGAFGAYLAAAAGGYLTYLFVNKIDGLFLNKDGATGAASKPADESGAGEPVKEKDPDPKE